MAILGLGYIGIGASDIPAWRRFAQDVLGTAVADGPDGSLKLRVDARDWRISVEPGSSDDITYAGWEVAGAAELHAMADRIESSGTRVERDDGTLAKLRGVKGIARFTDPAGIVGELFCGATERGHEPFFSPKGVSGFLTGDQGLGHIVVATNDLNALDHFYRDVLGFRLSDYIDYEIKPGLTLPVTFLHCNQRHHSFAFAPAAPGSAVKLVHFMLQTNSLDDVGFALDRCETHDVPLSLTLGRHSNDLMLSFYAFTPSGFEVEYGWGARTIEGANWSPVRYEKISNWGHKSVAPRNTEKA